MLFIESAASDREKEVALSSRAIAEVFEPGRLTDAPRCLPTFRTLACLIGVVSQRNRGNLLLGPRFVTTVQTSDPGPRVRETR
jgi:hypothetical protein